MTLSEKRIGAKCKPDTVMNLKSGVGRSPRISPEKAEEIRRKISRLNPQFLPKFCHPCRASASHRGEKGCDWGAPV